MKVNMLMCVKLVVALANTFVVLWLSRAASFCIHLPICFDIILYIFRHYYKINILISSVFLVYRFLNGFFKNPFLLVGILELLVVLQFLSSDFFCVFRVTSRYLFRVSAFILLLCVTFCTMLLL